MAKTKISEFSATPANNTDIDSINIAEGCAPSGINDAIRELMAQLKDFQTGAVGDSFNGPIGTTTAAAGAFTTLSASSTLGVTGVSTLTGGAVVQGLTVGRGAGAVATNSVLGSGALQANTTASNNTAVGYQAGYSATTSTPSNNTFIGYTSGYGVSSQNNVAVGAWALQGSSTGIGNTAIGLQSMYSNTSGTSNVATGLNSLFTNGSGSNNTAHGHSALYSNTTSSYSTAVGFEAGYTQTSGADYNTFIGYRAGKSTTGDQNTFLGKFAGNAVTTGATNTIVGAFNGNQSSLDIRTASNYTVISDGGGTPHLAAYAGGTVALQGAIPVAGTGITFPATQSASSNANTLDDYEEGTWTPAITFDGISTGISYNVRVGKYTKVGNIVFVTCGISLGSKGSATGSAEIAGLPFTIGDNGAYSDPSATVGYSDSFATNDINWTCNGNRNQTAISIRRISGASTISLTNANFNNNSSIILEMTYQV